MKDVYFNHTKNEISFIWVKNENVCFGETDATLEEFVEWMKTDWLERGLDISKLPTIEKENESKTSDSRQ
jgi:hypothetical protein